ncbi:MAG: tRNA uridine-5-carboxymethylaminomethyl(34) synthesis GTPase MnmE [Rhodobacterales bacterium]|nr:MAG: tRNA uridine-5-carboxymethylaminomethyl(34) synthesis GTPase MnmE [Rhodobacterales bacterium]
MDTIFALASAPGKAGVAVVRVSGPACATALARFGVSIPEGGRGLRRLMYGEDAVDEALLLHFASGASFTGEEVVELHLHGSPAIVARVLSILEEIDGVRLSEPGEFTRRAFDNGRLDLAQVEGLADLIEAETEAQRKQALRVLSGELGKQADHWRGRLTRVLALFTAGIDFADEEIPDSVTDGISDDLSLVIKGLEAELAKGRAAEAIRNGFEVAIVGPPNAGKSTLLNRLAGRDAAITSDVAGTTRDVIEVRMDLGGLPVTFLDTAGLRETQDAVEAIGVARARERAEQADMRIFLTDGAGLDMKPLPGDLVLQAKVDLHPEADRGVSGLTGRGVDALVSELTTTLTERVGDGGLAIRHRHRDAMRRAIGYLGEAREALVEQGDDVIAAELVMDSVRALDSLVGRVDVEAILGDIFSTFCIGK